MTDSKVFRIRAIVLFLVTFLVGAAVVWQVAALQFGSTIPEDEQQEVRAMKLDTIHPIRGTIYSADAQILATSDPRFDIRMDLMTVDDDLFNEKVDSLAMRLSTLFGDRSYQQYKELLTRARREERRYQLIQRDVSGRDLKLLKKMPIYRQGKYRGGLIAEPMDRRKKPYGLLAFRTIGYERQGAQKVGLEGAFSNELRGQKGLQMMRKEGNHYIPLSDRYEQEPKNGYDLYTTIDVNIQDVAESELLKRLKELNAKGGCAILMEVETGYIKAIANLQRTEEGNYFESYNQAIGSSTEPGSTFKLPSLMVALEDGLIDLDDSVETGDGRYKFYDRTMRDSKHGGYGKLTVRDVFAKSSNVGVSKVINDHYAMNPDKFVNGLKRMGLSTPTGISIKGEGAAFIREVGSEGWSGTSLPWMSIGYEVLLTPLQILTFYNAIANGGTMVRPQLVKEIRDGSEVVETFEPEVILPMISSPGTIRKAQELLESVVEYGTGRKLQAAHFQIAGKTGTTQMSQGLSGYGKAAGEVKHQASFVGYFPAESPKYACIVVITAPEGSVYYGADVSGTVFRAIADKVYATSIQFHDPINDHRNNAVADLPNVKAGYRNDIEGFFKMMGWSFSGRGESDWVFASTDRDKMVLESIEVSGDQMPRVTGMSARDALFLLENMGLIVDIHGSGRVVKQSIRQGERIEENMLVTLELE